MRVAGRNRSTGRRFLAPLLAVTALLAVPAVSHSAQVTVTPSPATLPEPGGIFQFTVSISNESTMTFQDHSVLELNDSIYGNLNGKGTCAVNQPLPYTCTFPGGFNGLSGATQTNTVTAGLLGIQDPMGIPNPVNFSKTGSATVSLGPAAKKKCGKGKRLKKIKRKGKKPRFKCVKKKRKRSSK